MPLNKDKPFPKRPRLKCFDYAGTYAYFITLSTKDRNNWFKEAVVAEPIIGFMRDVADKQGFVIDAFCLMPDHLHLLLRGLDKKADLRNFIKSFKQRSGYWFKQSRQKNLWQLSYYDHVLRKDQAIKDAAIYILCNPVRKGLVSDYKAYPFSGSFTMDINTL